MAEFGGKMLYEQTITESSQQKIAESGLSISAAAQVGYDGGVASASVAISGGVEQNSKSDTKSTSSAFDVKIYVFGGVPPASGASTEAGFAEWSDTIHDMPSK